MSNQSNSQSKPAKGGQDGRRENRVTRLLKRTMDELVTFSPNEIAQFSSKLLSLTGGNASRQQGSLDQKSSNQGQSSQPKPKAKPKGPAQQSVSSLNERWYATTEYEEFIQLQDQIKDLKFEGKEVPKELQEEYTAAQGKALSVKQRFREVGPKGPSQDSTSSSSSSKAEQKDADKTTQSSKGTSKVDTSTFATQWAAAVSDTSSSSPMDAKGKASGNTGQPAKQVFP